MNPKKRDAIRRKYHLFDEKRVRLAYRNVFRADAGNPDVKIVIMDQILNAGLFERSGRDGGTSMAESVAFGDGKKAAIARILEMSGLEDVYLSCIDPDWSEQDYLKENENGR